MRDEKEERKKQARSNKQTRQSNTCTLPGNTEFNQDVMYMMILHVHVCTCSIPYPNCSLATLRYPSTNREGGRVGEGGEGEEGEREEEEEGGRGRGGEGGGRGRGRGGEGGGRGRGRGGEGGGRGRGRGGGGGRGRER